MEETGVNTELPVVTNNEVGKCETVEIVENSIDIGGPVESSTEIAEAEFVQAVAANEHSIDDDHCNLSHDMCLARLEEQRIQHEEEVQQLRATLAQKDGLITLHQRENAILEKEKRALWQEKEIANREKESTVIKFAVREKLLIDAKKEREAVEKQLADAKKEAKNAQARFQAVSEDKSRISYLVEEKCNEVRKYQRECERLRAEMQQLDSKLKYHMNRLSIEFEAKTSLERKLEEERNAPSKSQEKANEKLRLEYEANVILLKHEVASKTESLDNLTQEHGKAVEALKAIQAELQEERLRSEEIASSYAQLQEEHFNVQAALSDEMLSAAKLRGQLEDLQVLRSQHAINEEKLRDLQALAIENEQSIDESTKELQQTRRREEELLSVNKELSEAFAQLQNEVSLLKAEMHAIHIENDFLKREKSDYDDKYAELENKLKAEVEEKQEERLLLTRIISERTKAYELSEEKLEHLLGEFESAKRKNIAVVKELQREIQKYKKLAGQPTRVGVQNKLGDGEQPVNGSKSDLEPSAARSVHVPNCNGAGRIASESSDCAGSKQHNATNSVHAESGVSFNEQEHQVVPSRQHLIERILRLQQASRRQTEKIEFLENHTMALVTELQRKSRIVQYYMLGDKTAGALTSAKSDEHKSELAKYGNGVMSAIYNGLKGESKDMTLELSLEINKKLQTVLEDTLLKNITLKENLDILGQEVHKLTRKLHDPEAKPI